MSDEILKEVGGLLSLAAVMDWALRRTPPATLVNVVTQDEFTHDVIFKTDAAGFLVFDTT